MITPTDPQQSDAPKARWISKLKQLHSSNQQPNDTGRESPTAEQPPSAPVAEAQSLGEMLRSEISQTMGEAGIQADELANRLEKRLEAASQNMRAEMQRTMAAFRREVQRSYESYRRELKWIVFWQWMATLALFAAYIIRQQ